LKEKNLTHKTRLIEILTKNVEARFILDRKVIGSQWDEIGQSTHRLSFRNNGKTFVIVIVQRIFFEIPPTVGIDGFFIGQIILEILDASMRQAAVCVSCTR
jgi:hypothetical protein